LRAQPEVPPDDIEELYVFPTINVLRGQCVDLCLQGRSRPYGVFGTGGRKPGRIIYSRDSVSEGQFRDI